MTTSKRFFAALLAASLAAAPAMAQAPAAALMRIGAAAAVKGVVNAQAPGAVGRVVSSGKPLYLNDHVTTDAAGRMQVMLLDETIFTIGPSSDMVLDEFVYDPNTSAGKVSASIVKGTFRFVTGKVARKDPDHMKVKLAVGTIGIRGSVAVGETGPNGSTIINGGAGDNNDGGENSAGIFVSNNGKTTDLRRPGSGATITPGSGPSGAQNMGGKLAEIMGGLQAKSGGGTGGSGGQADAGSGGKGGAGDASGKNTALGGILAGDSGEEGALAAASDLTTGNAAQQSSKDMIQGDAWYFSGHSPITCAGVGCVGGGNPVGAVQLYVNFTNKTFGGATTFVGPSSFSGSFIHLHGINVTAQGDTIQQLIGGGGSGLNPISFSSLPTTITLQSGTNMDSSTTGLSVPGTGNFDGTTITLSNTATAAAQVNLTFTGTNTTTNSINSSGSFAAPYYKP